MYNCHLITFYSGGDNRKNFARIPPAPATVLAHVRQLSLLLLTTHTRGTAVVLCILYIHKLLEAWCTLIEHHMSNRSNVSEVKWYILGNEANTLYCKNRAPFQENEELMRSHQYAAFGVYDRVK